MGVTETEIFNKIIERTDSTLLLFFILIIIAFVLIFIPLYKLSINDRTKRSEAEALRDDKSYEREVQLLQVITKNTEVISELKSLFGTSGAELNEFSSKINLNIASLIDKVDQVLTKVAVLENNISILAHDTKPIQHNIKNEEKA